MAQYYLLHNSGSFNLQLSTVGIGAILELSFQLSFVGFAHKDSLQANRSIIRCVHFNLHIVGVELLEISSITNSEVTEKVITIYHVVPNHLSAHMLKRTFSRQWKSRNYEMATG